MRKINTKNMERPSWRFLAATSLAFTLAAFGCTTNRYPGNGEPSSMNPSYGPSNHSVTPGSSSGTGGNPPMASMYSGAPRVDTDALATLAADQGFRGRVLGPVAPEGVQAQVPQQPFGGQLVPPAVILNPIPSVNPSVNSVGYVATTGGVGGGGGTVVISAANGATSGAATTAASSATTQSLIVSGATNVGATPPSGAVIPATIATSPTVSGGNALFAPAIVNGVVSGTTPAATTARATTAGSPMTVTGAINVGATPASGTVIPATTASTPTVTGNATFTPRISNATVSGTTRVSAPAVSSTARLTSARVTTAAARSATGVVVAPIQIVTNSTGQIMVTNTAPTTKSSKP